MHLVFIGRMLTSHAAIIVLTQEVPIPHSFRDHFLTGMRICRHERHTGSIML